MKHKLLDAVRVITRQIHFYCALSHMNFVRCHAGLVLAVLTGITLGIAMGMVLLITVHCARYR